MALEKEIEAFTACQADLERDHPAKWVVFHDSDLVGVFDSFDEAAQEAVQRFGRGPYLIRQVGAPDIALPASIMYRIAS